MGNYGWGVRRLKFSPVQIVNVMNGKLVWSGGRCGTIMFQWIRYV